MNNCRSIALAILTSGLLSLGSHSAFALTNQDVSGVYQGTSVATLPNGATVTANLTLTLKPQGNLKTVATVNGQTSTAKGKYQFVSEHGITETTAGGEAVALVDLNGSTLTINVLVRLDSGDVVKEVTMVTLVKKL